MTIFIVEFAAIVQYSTAQFWRFSFLKRREVGLTNVKKNTLNVHTIFASHLFTENKIVTICSTCK